MATQPLVRMERATRISETVVFLLLSQGKKSVPDFLMCLRLVSVEVGAVYFEKELCDERYRAGCDCARPDPEVFAEVSGRASLKAQRGHGSCRLKRWVAQ